VSSDRGRETKSVNYRRDPSGSGRRAGVRASLVGCDALVTSSDRLQEIRTVRLLVSQ